jgi:hypothetical protein
MKGQVEVVLVALTALMVVAGLYLNMLIGNQIGIKQIAKETDVIEAVNKMEAVKKGLSYSLFYSYLEALNREGYTSFSEVKDQKSFKSEVSSVFNEYRDAVKEKSEIIVPGGELSLTSTGSEVIVSFTSTGFLTYESSSTELSFSIFESPNATIKIVDDKLVDWF